jgi:hypothetical protein
MVLCVNAIGRGLSHSGSDEAIARVEWGRNR